MKTIQIEKDTRIPGIHDLLFLYGFSYLPLKDWELSGKVLTTGFDKSEQVAFRFYLV